MRTFIYSLGFAAVAVAVVNALNVPTWMHDRRGSSLGTPIVAEGTSGFIFLLLFRIAAGWGTAGGC